MGLSLRTTLTAPKQAAQKTTATSRFLLRLRLSLLQGLLGLLKLELELLNTVLRFNQCHFLHHSHLRNTIAGFRVLLEFLRQEFIRIRVYRRQIRLRAGHASKTGLGRTAHSGYKFRNEVAFLVGHRLFSLPAACAASLMHWFA